MVTVIQERDQQNPWAGIAEKGITNAVKGYTERSDEMALKRSMESLGEDADPRDVLKAIMGTNTYGKEAKDQALQNYMGIEKFTEVKRHAQKQEEIAVEKNRIAQEKAVKKENNELLEQSLEQDGMPDYEAKLFTRSPKAVQSRIMANHQEQKARGLRQPIAQPQQGVPQQQQVQPQPEQGQQQAPQEPQPVQEQGEVGPEIAPPKEVEKAIEQVTPKKDEWPKVEPPPETTYAEKEKWRTKNADFNNKELKELNKKRKTRAESLAKTNRLTTLNDSGKIPDGAGRIVINPNTGEPYAVASLLGLVNPETQVFVKTINDYLSVAKDFFGGRVTDFDIKAFKSRLPNLLNTQDGRRMIIEQMKLMEELQAVYDEELEKGFKHYGRNASYDQITKVVDEKVELRQQEVIKKINSLDKASKMLGVMQKDPSKKNHTLMQSPPSKEYPEGQWKAVPNDKVNEAKGRQWMKW